MRLGAGFKKLKCVGLILLAVSSFAQAEIIFLPQTHSVAANFYDLALFSARDENHEIPRSRFAIIKYIQKLRRFGRPIKIIDEGQRLDLTADTSVFCPLLRQLPEPSRSGFEFLAVAKKYSDLKPESVAHLTILTPAESLLCLGLVDKVYQGDIQNGDYRMQSEALEAALPTRPKSGPYGNGQDAYEKRTNTRKFLADKYPDIYREIVEDREAVAARRAADLLKASPDAIVIIVYGFSHDFARFFAPKSYREVSPTEQVLETLN